MIPSNFIYGSSWAAVCNTTLRLVWGIFFLALAGRAVVGADDTPATVLESTPAGALAFSPDGTWLAIGAEYKGPLKLWKVGGNEAPRVVEDVKAMFNTVGFSSDGKFLTASRISLDPAESVVSVWDVKTRQRLMEYKSGAFWSVFTPDNKGVAIGKFSTVEFLDPKTGTRLSGYRAHENSDVSAGAFAANGKLFVTAGAEAKQLRTWDAKTGKSLRTIPLTGECRTISVAPDARQIACVLGKTVTVVNADDGHQVWSSDSHEDTVMKVCYSPDGKEIATASHDRTVRRWNAADGAPLKTYEPDRGVVQTVAYSPDQKNLAIGTSGVVLIYSLSGTAAETPLPSRTSTSKSRPEVAQPTAALKFKTRQIDWKVGEDSKPVVPAKQGIAFISGLAGNLGGTGDSFELQVSKDGSWTLSGKSADFLAARATAITDLAPVQFAPQITRYEWSNGKPAVKMLHRKDGICVLAGVSGAFRGYGEEVKVRLADDGYWYLEGKSAQGELHAKAIGLKWSKPGLWLGSATTHSWTTGQDEVEVGKLSDGLCVLSGFSGGMLGGGEGVEIVAQDNFWRLRGSSQQQELRFDAMLIRFENAKK